MKKLGASKRKIKAKHQLLGPNATSVVSCRRCYIKLQYPKGTEERKAALRAYHGSHHPRCPELTANKKKATGSVAVAATLPPSAPTNKSPANVVKKLHSMVLNDDFVSDFKVKIDKRMETLELEGKPKWALMKRSAPATIRLAVDILLSTFQHRRSACQYPFLPESPKLKKAMKEYYSLFPLGTATFTFPEDRSGISSKAYSGLAGQRIIYLDWQLAFPKQPLPCPKCGGFLVHKQTNFQKNKGSLFPIHCQDGAFIWCVIMKYACSTCQGSVDANDGRLLQLLPPHIAATYPVSPENATDGARFHLHKDWMQDFEQMLPELLLPTAPATYPLAQAVHLHKPTRIPRLHHRCYAGPPYFCQRFFAYCSQTGVRGKPPHDPLCPKRMVFNPIYM